jgi:hypothetical protein
MIISESANKFFKYPIAIVILFGLAIGFFVGYYAHEKFPEKLVTVIVDESINNSHDQIK